MRQVRKAGFWSVVRAPNQAGKTAAPCGPGRCRMCGRMGFLEECGWCQVAHNQRERAAQQRSQGGPACGALVSGPRWPCRLSCSLAWQASSTCTRCSASYSSGNRTGSPNAAAPPAHPERRGVSPTTQQILKEKLRYARPQHTQNHRKENDGKGGSPAQPPDKRALRWRVV